MDIILILMMKIYKPSSYINKDMKVKNCIISIFLIVSLFMHYYVVLSLLFEELGTIGIFSKRKKQMYLWKSIYC